jgi:SulP family sulfate permease
MPSNLQHYKGDIFGGITAAIVALPLALAFGVSSGVGALAGLYGAILTGFFAAIFGGTKVQVSGPTGPMTVVMALVVTHFSSNLTAAFTAVMLAGLIQIVLGKLGVGRFIKLMPQPVVSGFMSGIGFIIIILQISALFGHSAPDGSTIIKLVAIPDALKNINNHSVIIASITLAIMFLTPSKIDRFLPSPLIAVTIGTLSSVLIFTHTPLIGAIPSGMPTLYFPQVGLSDLPYILKFAMILAFLGAIDSLLTSLVADSITRTSHDSNKELVGQGIGNIAAGIFGGLPGAGATMRTLINVRAGGNSRLSGALHSLLLLFVMISFGDIASRIPLAVLAGILVKVGIDIIDWNYLKRIHIAPRNGVTIMLTTLLMTVFIDLITAVAVGFVMASTTFVSRMAKLQINSAKFAYGSNDINDLSKTEKKILINANKKIILFYMQGPLSFGSTRDIAKMMQSGIDKENNKGALVIEMTDIPFIDSSAANSLIEVIQQLHETNHSIYIFGANSAVTHVLKRTGVIEYLGEENLLMTRIEALEKAQTSINQQD